MNFTKRKFLKLKPVTQHIQSAQALRLLYLELLQKQTLNQALFKTYQDIETWLNLRSITPSFEEISKRYHYHLSEAEKDCDTDHILPFSKHFDSPSGAPFLPIDIYLEDLRSLHNIGSIIRTTEAFRLGSLHFSKTFDLNHPKVKKTSMGCESLVSCKKIESFDELKKPFIGIEICENSSNIFDFTFPSEFSLILGNEEYGLRKQTLNKCDYILHIPLYGQKNSLNVANAFTAVAAIIRQQLS